MSFTLGCDPEVIWRRNGQFVSASNYFKANSSFGLDGCESTAEQRPGFSESPVDPTSKIYQILDYGHDKAPDLELYAGHFVDSFAIGSDTHFSIDSTAEIIEALDNIPIKILDDLKCTCSQCFLEKLKLQYLLYNIEEEGHIPFIPKKK
jgi:hypothetical protein